MKSGNDAAELPLGVEVRARRCEPSSFGTADCSQVCRCDDGSDYAVKDSASGELVPHSEWFCTHLGEAVGLASPPCKVVNVQGKRCFGSRWETGHNARDWWLRASAGEIDFHSLALTLSRIYAFDLFVNNIDRHATNYIVREQHFGTALLAFDYSRAWLVHGVPPPTLPLPEQCNTVQLQRSLCRLFGEFFNVDEATHVLDSLIKVDGNRVESIIGTHPQEWLTNEQRDGILNWWVSSARTARAEAIVKGVKDGSYL